MTWKVTVFGFFVILLILQQVKTYLCVLFKFLRKRFPFLHKLFFGSNFSDHKEIHSFYTSYTYAPKWFSLGFVLQNLIYQSRAFLCIIFSNQYITFSNAHEQVSECENSKVIQYGKAVSKRIARYTKPLLVGTEQTAGKVWENIVLFEIYSYRIIFVNCP